MNKWLDSNISVPSENAMFWSECHYYLDNPTIKP